MKANKYIAGILALFAANSASAATFEITGATAFRRATIDAVHALYTSGGNFRFAHNKGTDYQSADFITFEGTVTGLPGTTVIRCSFNGSIEGLRALTQPGQSGIVNSTNNGDAYYIKTSSLTGALANPGTNVAITVNTEPSTDSDMERAEAEMAFSDTDIAISPYSAAPVETLGSVGAVAFAVCSSQGSGITNVTYQQYNSLLTNGYVPKSFFTGVATDTSRVFCTGRNDGSGTRSSYLSEMGFGVSNPVQQYLVIRGSGEENNAIQLVPAGGTNDIDPVTTGVQFNPTSAIGIYHAATPVTQLTTSASTAWGQDVDGNGGAFSGSAITGPLGRSGTSVRVFAANGGNLFGGVAQSNVSLVSWISGNDAITARKAGAIVCSFNGISLDIGGTGNTGVDALTTADKAKITSGAYSAWNFQQFYYLSSADQNTVDLYTSLHGSISGGVLGAAGIASADFTVGRLGDGGTINPFE